jgi:hypothetical protein
MKQRIAIAVLIGLLCGLGFGVHAQPGGSQNIPTYAASHITTSTTTTVRSGASVLHTICVNTKAASTTATVYNSTAASGTVIAVIDVANLLGCLSYDVAMGTGITVVTTSGTPDITVTYKNIQTY